MKKLFFLLLLLPMLVVSQENESYLLNLSEITVKNGHNAQFLEGVKAWKECYLENNGEDKWNMWKRIQGEGTVYTLTSMMANWAEMDEDGDDASKECRMTVVNLIMPHVESIHYNIGWSMPDYSRSTPLEDMGLVWVYNVKVNNSTAFKEVVSEISKAVKAAEGDNRGTWYSVVGGGPEVSDYFIAVPFKNFAGLDVDTDSVWTVYEKANGKKKTDALRDKFRACIDSDWAYIYTLNKKLSN
ncbi:hypothetical protein [Seonamhaeicola aphaedonensis]|uniref:Uncharacterized protein n=1 Tax=Seonamhaeicola aphaedonensis TaxID=1461338 RepID=A0A3D9H7M4_9FLAO|nr:hypothetical protein [Seonamhaeicola aphaedonensis]RED44956.1 hypothetical protein DFQ02_10973 [Seonamhaeicola aphaedonensis]